MIKPSSGTAGIAALLLSAALLCSSFGAGAQQAPASPVTPVKPAARSVPALSAPAPSGSFADSAPVATHALDAADLGAWLDGRVPYALKSGDIAGAVVIVVKDGKVLLQKGYGLADVAANKPMDAQTTLVRPGSTSKLFTWTAVMQQVALGKIDLDRSVNDYLDFKIEERFGKPVTIRDLMNHRAGFEEGLKELLAYDLKKAPTTERYLKDHPRPMLFAPGATPGYSNYGAALAGYIVERVSGEPFDDYVDKHIFAPLGMRSSTFTHPLPAKLAANMSKGYRVASGPASEYELVITRPAGSLAATAADMGRFMLAHLQQGSVDGATILDPATTALMHTATQTSLPGFGVMAHGFFLEQKNGHTMLGHGGDTVVFHSELSLLPDDKVGIFVSFNSQGKDAAAYGARKELMDGFIDRYFPAPKVVDAPVLATAVADAQKIAGRYESSRRVEHGFLSVLYLMQQSVISANADGTIEAAGGPSGGMVTFREVAPQLWREKGGTHTLAMRDIDGVQTVIDSENPIAVLQQASFYRGAPLNLTILSLSLLVIIATLVLWPLGALLLRAHHATIAAGPAVAPLRRVRLVQRLAALVSVTYLFFWYLLIKPVLSVDLGIYSAVNDWMVGGMELAGVLAIAAAGAGIWAAVRMHRLRASILSRIWAVLVALALVGIVWVAAVGQLMTWNLNY
jgi:CubicO group peptidase (beta-lactamase class C family)